MNNLFNLNGKVAVVTGGGGVLCSAIAKALAASGAKVAVLDLNKQAADATADAISAEGRTAIGVQCDVLSKVSLEEARESVENLLGPVSLLVNGAGGNKKAATTSADIPFFALPADAIRFVFDLNVLSVVLASQVFAKGMAERGEGSILNISSMNSFRPLTKIPAYSAAKAATSNFTQWLAVHLCQEYSSKIRVNAIAPGFFRTEQNRFLLTDERTNHLTARGQQIIDHTPMGRFGEPEDLIGTVLWLLGDAARFVTGIVVPVDGGFSAFSGV